MALVRRALRLSFLLVNIIGFVTPLSDIKRADLALPDSCLIETNKNAAHGKINYSREWPTTATAKECAKVANLCHAVTSTSQTPCSVWVWHDASMGQWAYTCILWSMSEASEHGRADIDSWVEQSGVTSGMCFTGESEPAEVSWRAHERERILNASTFNGGDSTALLASQMLALPFPQSPTQQWKSTTKKDPKGRFNRKQTEMNELEWWLVTNGAHFPKMKVHVVEGSEEGGAVIVTEAVPRGEVLAVIPYELMFSLRTVEREMKKRFGIDSSLRLSGNYNKWRDYVALCLAVNRKDPQHSFYTPYIRALPKHLPHLPAFYDAETRKLLEGTTIEYAVRDKEENYRNAWLRVQYLHTSIRELLTEEDFFWALGIVDSRSFSMSPPINWEQVYDYRSPVNLRYGNTVAGSDPLSVEAREMQTSTAQSQGLGRRINMCQSHGSALVPLADMLNHAAQPNVLWAFDPKTDAFILLAAADMEAGQKAIDSYGQKGNKEFLGQYGFTLKEAEVEVALRVRSDVTRDLAISLDHWKPEWCEDPEATNIPDAENLGPEHLNQNCSRPNMKLEGKLIESLKIPSNHGIKDSDDPELIFCQQDCMWEPKCMYWTIQREITYSWGSTTNHGSSMCNLFESISNVYEFSQPDDADPGDFGDFGYTSGSRHCLWLRPHCSYITKTKFRHRDESWSVEAGRGNDLLMTDMKLMATQVVNAGSGSSSIRAPFIISRLRIFPHGLMPLLRSTAPPPMRCAGAFCTKKMRRHMVDEWALRLLHKLCQRQITTYPSTIEEDKDLLFKEWAMKQFPDWPTVSALKIRMWEKQTLEAVSNWALEGANFLRTLRSMLQDKGVLPDEVVPGNGGALLPWEMLLKLGNLVKPLNPSEIKINDKALSSDTWLQVTGIRPVRETFMLSIYAKDQQGFHMQRVKIELPLNKIDWSTERDSDKFKSFTRIEPPQPDADL